MRTKQMKAFILAAIFAFESMVAGYVSVSAQTMPQNSIIEAVETVQIASETADTEAENIESETTDIEVENVESETTDIEVENVESETAVAEEDIASETATEKYSGTDGALDWSIDTEGHLTVSGNGDYVKREYSSETGWLAYKDEIKSATVNVTGITNTSYMFNACNNLEKVDLSGLVMSNAENVEIDMQYMFHLCNSLKSLNLSSLDTSKVTNMDHMFYNCKNLTSLDLSGLVTSKVTNMKAMFMTCESLTSLNLSDFDTTHVTDMTCMFSECSSLESLNVSSFETGNVKMMMNMFYDCSSLTSLDISNFDTTNVINMGSMFDYCSKLKTINAPVDASTDADMMLPTRTDSSWIYQPTGETVRVVSSAGTYVRVCGGIDGALSWSIDTDDHLTVSGNGNYESRTSDDNEKGWLSYRDEFTTATVDVSQITDTSYMFYGCSNLESLDMSGLVTDSVTNMDAMFEGCISLNSINAPDNNSSVNMYLPVLPDESWIYSPTGETVTLINKAGTYVKGATVQTPEPDADGFIIQNGVLIGYVGSGGEIRIPDTVTSIGNEAFNYCDSLTGITIPDSVTSIGESAFCDCINLKSITIPVGVATIEPDTFLRCSSLESVTLPDSVTSIREGAFSNCSSLTSIEIPKDVTQIEDNVFYGCKALKSITIPSGVTSIGVCSFFGCNVEIMQLPDSVTTIGDWAFWYCENLKAIVIPGSVKDIMDNVFADCNSLQGIWGEKGSQAETYATNNSIAFYVYGETPLPTEDMKDFVIVDGVLTKYNGLGGDVIVPDGVTQIGNEAFLDCTEVISVQMPDGLTGIGDWAFNGCTKLASVGMPDGVTDIGTHAFDGCAALETIKIPESVKNIGEWAFYRCSQLTKLTIPEGVMSIGSWAFVNCVNLTSFHLPASVSYLGQEVFSGCDSLVSISVQAGNAVYDSRKQCNGIIESAENRLIAGCSSTVIVDGVTSVGDYAFSGVSNLKSIVIPEGIKSIGGFAFSNCTGLSSVTIPNSVTSIGSRAFWGCTNLTGITIPSSVTSIGKEAFDTGYLKEIRGYVGTYAYKYAIQNGITFRAIVIDLPPGDIVDTGDGDEGKTPDGDGELKGGNESEEKTPVVETNTETKKDGSVVTTEKTTYPEGNVSMTIISTSKDQKKQTRVDMEIDAQKNLTSAAIDVSKKVAKKTMTINLKELKKMVDQIEKCNVAYVHPLADGIDAESILAEDVLEGSTENITWSDELYVTAKKANISIKVTAKDNKGKDKYSLSIQKKDLTQKKFVVYSSDKKGSPVMTNPKSNYAKVNAKRDMTIKIASKGNYQLQNKKDAAKTNQKIMKTVTPAKTKVTVKPGSSTKFALSAKCNKANISKITYKADSSKVSVAKSGKISAKSSGTTKVTANVTMKNGAKKSIKMKVSVS